MKEVHHSFKQSHFTAHLLLISSPMNMVLWIVFGIGGWSWRLLKICIWYFWLLYIAKHFQVILSQKMNSHQRFASFEPEPNKCCFWCCQEKNSTPSCTMTSGPRSNASGELVQITPKPSSSGRSDCLWHGKSVRIRSWRLVCFPFSRVCKKTADTFLGSQHLLFITSHESCQMQAQWICFCWQRIWLISIDQKQVNR